LREYIKKYPLLLIDGSNGYFFRKTGSRGVIIMYYAPEFYNPKMLKSFGAGILPAILIREMPKTLEDVADLGSYICALDKG
jgi:hypothetical protein